MAEIVNDITEHLKTLIKSKNGVLDIEYVGHNYNIIKCFRRTLNDMCFYTHLFEFFYIVYSVIYHGRIWLCYHCVVILNCAILPHMTELSLSGDVYADDA